MSLDDVVARATPLFIRRFLMNNKTELTLDELRELLVDNEVGTRNHAISEVNI